VSRPPLEVPRLRRVPRQARSRERLQRLLDAAEGLLVAEGPAALTTTRVAEAAGVSVGSLYQYLPDKEAMVEALAAGYLTEFEGLMDELAAEAAAGAGWSDPVGTLLDRFARRYRERPGYRALWFGRELTPELRAADRENKLVLAERLRALLVGLGMVTDGERVRLAARTGVLVADALLQEAFRTDPDGEPALIEEAKVVLRGYLAAVAAADQAGGA
jgi:AcrR family transcriptional regulator